MEVVKAFYIGDDTEPTEVTIIYKARIFGANTPESTTPWAVGGSVLGVPFVKVNYKVRGKILDEKFFEAEAVDAAQKAYAATGTHLSLSSPAKRAKAMSDWASAQYGKD